MKARTLQNRYQTEKLLGQGRLSTVYRARDLQTGQTIALKILQPHLRAQTSVVQRFKREMAAVQRLDHEAIVRIFDIIDTPEHLALVMEYAPGQNLKSWVRANGAMPPERVIKIAQPLLEAIDQAHSRGILHRDLSLMNVILDEQNEDRIEIIGFGLARVDELVGLTMHTRVLGTLETMAPESILGQPIDAQGDLFSIGAMLYELVTARTLHDGRMTSSLAFATRHDYLEELQITLDATLGEHHEPLKHAILRALAPDPKLRFATAAQLQNALFGRYDQRVWQALENHTSQPCPQCKRALIQGVNHCVYCRHALSQLIEQPGGGDYFVQVISPHMAFRPDVWFETNTEPFSLTSEQVQALHDLMFSYEDTRRLFHPGVSDSIPPFLLFDSLTWKDAERVAILLRERNIPTFIGDRNHTGLRSRPVNNITQQLEAQAKSNINISLKNVALPDLKTNLFITNIAIVTAFIIALISFLKPLITGQPVSFTAPSVFLAMGLITLLAKLLIRMKTEQYTYLEDLFADIIRTENISSSVSRARIPGQRLRQLHHRIIDNVLPPEATQTLLSLHDPALQQEFHSVLELTVRLFRRDDIPVLALREQLQPMLDHTGTILKRLAFLQSSNPDSQKNRSGSSTPRNTAERFDAIARLDTQIAEASDIHLTERLIHERAALFQEMAALDAMVHETSLLKGQLLRVRASLLDLQTQFNTTQFPSLELVAEEISELKTRFDAEREVLELLENA